MPEARTPVARTPAHLMELFGERVGARDLDGLMELYEPDALFVPSPGELARGSAEIRMALARFLALEPRMDVRVDEVLERGDTALVVNEWSMVGTAPDGSRVEQGGRSADVLRRQPDGRWLVAIDHP